MSKPAPELADRCRHEIRNTQCGIEFFLPHPMVIQAFQFVLAAAAHRYNIGIVAYAMMPTHIHILIRPQLDPGRPYDTVLFRQFLRSNFARFLNSYWDGRENGGSVFCRDSIGDSIRVLDCSSELDQLTYIETNGVRGGLEFRPEALCGAMSLRKWLVEPLVVERPPIYFQKRTWNAVETLRLCVPVKFEENGHTAASFRKASVDALNKRVARIQRERRKLGSKTRRWRELSTQEPNFTFGRSAADHSRAWMVGECREEKAREFHNLRAFHAWHESALKRVKDGEEDVVFPPGTYKAAKRYGAKVANASRYNAPVRRRDRPEMVSRYDRVVENDRKRVIQLE